MNNIKEESCDISKDKLIQVYWCKSISIEKIIEYIENTYHNKLEQLMEVVRLCCDEENFKKMHNNKILDYFVPYKSFGNKLEEYYLIKEVSKSEDLEFLRYLVFERKASIDFVISDKLKGNLNLLSDFYGINDHPEEHKKAIEYLIKKGIDMSVGHSPPIFQLTKIENIELIKHVRTWFPKKWKKYLKLCSNKTEYCCEKKDMPEEKMKKMKSKYELIEKDGEYHYIFRTNDLLYSAIDNKNINLIEILLEDGMNPNEKIYETNFRRTEKTTYLYQATKLKSKEIIILLLTYGANPNDPCEVYGVKETPLEYCCKEGEIEIIGIFLEMFAYEKDNEIFPYQIEEKNLKYILEIPNQIKNMTLNYAIKNKNMKHIKRILNKTKNINEISKENENMTALECAIKFANTEIINLLLENGADPKIDNVIIKVTREKKYDILKLCLSYYPEYVNYMSKSKYNECSLLYILICDNELEMIEYLLNNKADINIKTSNGSNLLHLYLSDDYDSRRIEKDTIIFLINKGININALNNDNKTPLYEALITHFFYSSEILINNGASLELDDKPLYEIFKEDIRITSFLDKFKSNQ